LVGIDAQDVIEDVTIPLPRQVKIRMMGEIHHRRPVGSGAEFQL
jgi:hypothetical protein